MVDRGMLSSSVGGVYEAEARNELNGWERQVVGGGGGGARKSGMPSLSRALALRHCPAIGLARLSVLPACHLRSCQHALAGGLLIHDFSHAHGRVVLQSCVLSCLQLRCLDLVTPSPSIACEPHGVQQVSD